jgi:hypothetical protein
VSDPDALAALEKRLWDLLEPYRDRLEPHDIYGLPSLRWPGARAHDFFAGVRVASRHVALHLMPLYGHPEVLEGASEELRRRLKGRTTFNLRPGDEALLDELEALIATSFEAYRSAHAAP